MMYGILLQAPANGGDFMSQYGNLLMLGAVFVVFYFFMIRPQQKKQKELRTFRDNLQKGAEVVTTGGIFGKVVEVENNTVSLEIDKGVKIKVLKSSISTVTSLEEANSK